MMSGFGWAALALLFGYLALFFWGSAVAAQAAGRPVWLFARATGRDRLAAFGFRAAFALAFFGPLLWLALPMLHKVDPFWTEGKALTHTRHDRHLHRGPWRDGGLCRSDVDGHLLACRCGERPDRQPRLRRALSVQPQPDLCRTVRPAGRGRPRGPCRTDDPCGDPVPLVGHHAGPVGRGRPSSDALGPDYDRYAASVPRWIGFRAKETP